MDVLEVAILWIRDALPEVGGRVAARHRYGHGWEDDELGVSVHLDGGEAEVYAPIQRARVEVRIYGNEMSEVVDVWRVLRMAMLGASRVTVAGSAGTALLHSILPEGELSMLWDEETRKQMGVMFAGLIVG